ncbi:MAG TPA: hypothetical protein VGC88_06335 [Terriglobales bacterium]
MLAVVCLIFSVSAVSQTTLSHETSNNTSACDSSGTHGYCQAPFAGMSDSTGTVNPAPANVSTEDVHQLLYSGNTTKVFTHFQPWFCMNAGSLTTGPGTSCSSHIQVGYNSNDAATVAEQLADMQRRGFDGVVVDWYGAQSVPLDQTTHLIGDQLAAQCAGNACPFRYAIMYDQGALQWAACPKDGGGVDQTQCIANAVSSDFDYMDANFFTSQAYVRVGSTPVVMFFVCEECFTNPAPNWTSVWDQVRQHVAAYSDTPSIYFIYRNAGGFTHADSDGAFAWVNHYGTNDPFGLTYLDNFYDTAVAHPGLVTVGAGWKGFDNSFASWVTGTPSITSQQCGQTWLQTFQQATHKSDFGTGHQLPFLGVVTWNDYEEGSEIETGIDSCLSLSGSVQGNTLQWTPSFSQASGSEATVHHYLVFDSTDGQNLTQLAQVPSGTHSLDLSQFNLSSTSHTLFVKAVGQPSILNKMSAPITFAPQVTALSGIAISPSAIASGGSAIGTVSLTGAAPSSGLTISLASDNAAVQVPSQVSVASGASSATFPVTASTVSSATAANVTASYAGATQTASVQVVPVSVALALSPATVVGGSAVTGTVSLSSPAPNSGVSIALSSSSSVAKAPASVTIAAGATKASFSISTTPVATSTAASINATFGTSQSSVTLQVAPPSVSGLSVSPTSIGGSTSSTGTVTLNGPAPSTGTTVLLTSSSTAVTVPASVVVSAGNTTAKFTVSSKTVTATTTGKVTAAANGATASASLIVNVTPSALSLSPTKLKGGSKSTATVTLSGVAPSGGTVVTLSSSSTSAASVPSQITVPAGATKATFTVTTHAVSSTKTVTIQAKGWNVSRSATLTVTH